MARIQLVVCPVCGALVPSHKWGFHVPLHVRPEESLPQLEQVLWIEGEFQDLPRRGAK